MLNITTFRQFANYAKASTVPRAKSNKFLIRITPPINITRNIDGFEFLCESTDFPFHTFTVASEFYNLRHNKSVQGIDYDPITLSFDIDSGLFGNNRAMEMFLAWSNIIKPDSGLYGYLDEYAGTIEVDILNEFFNVYKTVTVRKAFPVNVDNLQLALENTDEIARLNISFEYENIKYT